jgi:queuine tRNA-ribosyltransferase
VAGEILAMVLNTIHNLRHYLNLMERIRNAIREGRYADFRNRYREGRRLLDGGANFAARDI